MPRRISGYVQLNKKFHWRTEEGLFHQLERLAKLQGCSVNTYLNQIAEDHVAVNPIPDVDIKMFVGKQVRLRGDLGVLTTDMVFDVEIYQENLLLYPTDNATRKLFEEEGIDCVQVDPYDPRSEFYYPVEVVQ